MPQSDPPPSSLAAPVSSDPDAADGRAGPPADAPVPQPDLVPLATLTQQFAEVIRQWGVLSNRQASTVARFERHLAALTGAGTRIEQDAAARVRELQDTILREWKEMREAQDAPAQQLQEHATSLTQLCMTTIDAAQRNWERSEARLAAIEHDLDRRLTDLSREVQAVAAELRAQRPQWETAPTGGTPWALDTVTRLHDEMRRVAQGDEAALVATRRVAPPAALQPTGLLPESAAAVAERLESLERDVAERDRLVRESVSRSTRPWRWVVLAIVVVTAATAVVAWRSRTEARAAADRVTEAQREVLAARQTAAQEVAAARADAAREVQQATEAARRAQLTGDVMAAPDLVRYSLIGRDALAGASAQLRWSRTRGMVFSGSRIVSPPADATYQIWLLGREGAVSLGTFGPQPGGVANVTSGPVTLPRPIIGALVTLEPAGGSRQPTGEVVFTRPAPPSPPAQ